MNNALETLIDDFALFDDWEDRYSYLIDLGKQITSLPDTEKTDDRLVQGCTSKVWLVMDWVHSDADEPVLDIRADSDAHIVRGLVAIVMKIYKGGTAANVLNVDMEDGFKQLGLEAHLSPSRRNGFFSMIEAIRAEATQMRTRTAAALN